MKGSLWPPLLVDASLEAELGHPHLLLGLVGQLGQLVLVQVLVLVLVLVLVVWCWYLVGQLGQLVLHQLALLPDYSILPAHFSLHTQTKVDILPMKLSF